MLFEGEKYPTLCSLSRLVTNLNMVLEDVRPQPSWNLGLFIYVKRLCSCIYIIVPFLLSVRQHVWSWLVGHNARFGHMQLHYSCLL